MVLNLIPILTPTHPHEQERGCDPQVCPPRTSREPDVPGVTPRTAETSDKDRAKGAAAVKVGNFTSRVLEIWHTHYWGLCKEGCKALRDAQVPEMLDWGPLLLLGAPGRLQVVGSAHTGEPMVPEHPQVSKYTHEGARNLVGYIRCYRKICPANI